MTDVISENESLRNQVESVGEMTRLVVVKYSGCRKVRGSGVQAFGDRGPDPEDKIKKMHQRKKCKCMALSRWQWLKTMQSWAYLFSGVLYGTNRFPDLSTFSYAD